MGVISLKHLQREQAGNVGVVVEGQLNAAGFENGQRMQVILHSARTGHDGSPSSVYRVLKKAGLLSGKTPNVTKKGTGFVQPLKAHQEWHVDVSYLNIAGTF